MGIAAAPDAGDPLQQGLHVVAQVDQSTVGGAIGVALELVAGAGGPKVDMDVEHAGHQGVAGAVHHLLIRLGDQLTLSLGAHIQNAAVLLYLFRSTDHQAAVLDCGVSVAIYDSDIGKENALHGCNPPVLSDLFIS